MIHEPSVDSLVEKIGNRYAVVVLIAKRARMLIDNAQSNGLTELPGGVKPLTAASMEMDAGKLICAK